MMAFKQPERIIEKNERAFTGRTIDMFGASAQYVCQVSDGCVVIYDTHQGLPVTLDIVNVLHQIRFEMGKSNLSRVVVYRDENGIFDGVQVDHCFNFRQFYGIGVSNLKEALEKAKACIYK